MMDSEIEKKGYKKVDNNIYEMEGVLFVQQFGEMVRMDMVDENKLVSLTDNKYRKYLKNDKPKRRGRPPMKKNDEKNDVLESKSQAYDLINVRDDQQVLIEIQGGFLDDFVYSFPTSQGKVTGLSWAGVKEVARQMGSISVEDMDISETPETYRVKCKAKDLNKDVTMFGVAEQSKKMLLKSGESVDDLHALSKCVSRAQRNAIRSLIPEIMIKTMIKEFQKK